MFRLKVYGKKILEFTSNFNFFLCRINCTGNVRETSWRQRPSVVPTHIVTIKLLRVYYTENIDAI